MPYDLIEYSRSPNIPEDEEGKLLYVAWELDKITEVLTSLLVAIENLDLRVTDLEP